MDNYNLLERAKIELREESSPFFNDIEIEYYLTKNELNFDKAMYEMCLLKAENDSINLPGGLSIPNNREYWLTIAKKYKPSIVRFI